MKQSTKTKTKRGSARDLFVELSLGVQALADSRHGKRTLRTQAVEFKPAPSVTPQELIRLRKSLKLSRASLRFTCGPTSAHWRTGSRAAPNQMLKHRS